MNSSKKPLIALVDDDRNILMSMEELLKKEDLISILLVMGNQH
jgi:FixJ family two-component response regulator